MLFVLILLGEFIPEARFTVPTITRLSCLLGPMFRLAPSVSRGMRFATVLATLYNGPPYADQGKGEPQEATIERFHFV